jgi:hypothetical protein
MIMVSGIEYPNENPVMQSLLSSLMWLTKLEKLKDPNQPHLWPVIHQQLLSLV